MEITVRRDVHSPGELRDARLGWSGTRLAQELGVSVSTLSRLECGVQSPSLDLANRWAALLGVEVKDLYALIGEVRAARRAPPVPV